ncbi:hypothetical protein [Encephalitozoon cuniculi GB-M1]|uniref:Cytosolic Fe-S cluster assembly factor NAR1 n=1 Tax=Encephalitozoon cuniculi (strain GB-M1) TaxID=284813 RepID=NAR1_ENCCU|nr:uncharacterized protein ECU05_0970 [Encephalitozoon cuniculi GB-M1]Q8SVJ2.2 RecName: Full=Cytosolic Fe-S cluster assembly factor NAR1; AltName: Full=Nuclear architecture-related protein 1 [Encephalitozoon cuniculi GB-M1]CAD26617.2 hypothetical protein [Encephalitozoon cuniculi GB-M1]
MSFFADLPKDNKKCIKIGSPLALSLSDCLACSGCVSADEAGALSEDLSFVLDLSPQTSFVLSPQSKINIFNLYREDGMEYREFEAVLSSFLRSKFNIHRIVDTSYLRSKIYEETYREYMATNHLIVSACPGVVTYIERTAPYLIGYLSRVKSPQQMAFSLVKGSRTVSVMPCQDKKLENGRDGVKFDFILTTRGFCKALDSLGFRRPARASGKSLCSMEEAETTQWNIGTSSGGYAEFILGKHCVVETREIRNGIKEHLLDDGRTISQITGLENSINYFKSSKTKGPRHKMTEIFLCKNGCIGGPGQERVNDVEMDIREYDRNGREQPRIFYSSPGLEEKRVFREVKAKRVDLRVDW